MSNWKNCWHAGVMIAAASVMLAGCKGGEAVIPVSPGTAQPPTTANPTPSGNSAPTITGTPATSAATASSYSFAPTAADADNDQLAFSISGKPAWATFSTTSGTLSGTAQAGTWSSIVITVSDGKSSASLAPFSLTVTNTAAGASTGTATLSWNAPAVNTDGSALTDLTGYWVYHGTSPTALGERVHVDGASTTTYTFSSLVAGTHYFGVSAHNGTGAESGMSSVGTKTVL